MGYCICIIFIMFCLNNDIFLVIVNYFYITSFQATMKSN